MIIFHITVDDMFIVHKGLRKTLDDKKVPRAFTLTGRSFDQVVALAAMSSYEGNKSHVIRDAVDAFYQRHYGDGEVTHMTKLPIVAVEVDAVCDPLAVEKSKI